MTRIFGIRFLILTKSFRFTSVILRERRSATVRIPYNKNEFNLLKEYYYEKQKLFVIILFSSEEKSIKKVAEDTCDCVLGLPQRFK